MDVQSLLLQTHVGGHVVSPVKDLGLLCTRSDDSSYIFGATFGVPNLKDLNVTIKYNADLPAYFAPEDFYSTARSMGLGVAINKNYNLTWILSVDAGFLYMIRLHFCEIQYLITISNMRVFTIYINNQTSTIDADVIAWTGRIGIPYYVDYVVVTTCGGMVDLWVELHLYEKIKPVYIDALLNGIEVFKIEDTSNHSLVSPNPDFLSQPTVNYEKVLIDMRRKYKSAGEFAGGAIGGIIACIILCFLIFIACKKRTRVKAKDACLSNGPSGWHPLSLYGNSHSSGSAKTNTIGSVASYLLPNMSKHFTFAEIEATKNGFDESSLLLGVGGFGKVYKGEIDNGTMKVAIKRGNPMSDQGMQEE